jgi:beta-lactamase class A
MTFGRKKTEVGNKDEVFGGDTPRRIKRIRPKAEGKEVIKPWDRYERLFVLIVFILTVGTSGILALTSRNFKLPNLPRITIPKISLDEINPFKEKIIEVGGKGTDINREKIESTKNKFNKMTKSYSGIYAFYIYDLNGDYYYGVNHQEVMQAASLIKLPVMYLALKENNDEKLVEAMGKRSDNNAFTQAVEILGKEKIENAILNLGMVKTSFSENKTTPEEIGLFLKKLYKNEILSQEKSERLQSYMTDTIFNDWLRKGIPSEVKVSHKYARELRSVSDAGVIYSKNPFIMVIMTDGVIERDADELIPNLANLLYTEHTK